MKVCMKFGSSSLALAVAALTGTFAGTAAQAQTAAPAADTATTAEIGKLFATNAVSPIRLARKLLGSLAPGKGVLAFMTSRMGSIEDNSSGGMELYRASKSALNSMIKSFVAGLDGKDLTVIAMHPGWVKTDMGGANAPLDVTTSVRGMVDQLEERAGKGGLAFIDYQGETLPW